MTAMLADWYFEGTPMVLEVVRGFAVFVMAWLVPLALLVLAVYVLFSIPLRRRERARFFLDLVESGLAQGRTAEQTILGAASTRDRSPGVRFHMLAAHLESGCRLSEALDRVPRLLPAQILSMLRVGEEVGDLRKVLPACRAHLQDALARAGNALHSMPLMLYGSLATPAVVLVFLQVFILPKLKAIAVDMETELPPVTRLVFSMHWLMVLVVILASFFLVSGLLSYWGGPRLQGWARSLAGPVFDSLLYRIPWRRERLHRDFAGLLALLLDAELPEERAVQMAAAATVNGTVMARARQVVEDLKQGVALPAALGRMDARGEFAWRVANAAQAHGPGRFTQALAGWWEALDARAFQLEQTATQLLTTGFVLLNGLIVGSILVGIFAVLVHMIENLLV